MMKPEPAPVMCCSRSPKRRRNSRPSGVSRNSGGRSRSRSAPDTVSVTAILTTEGSTFLTSGAKLSGAPRASAVQHQKQGDRENADVAAACGMRREFRAFGGGASRWHRYGHATSNESAAFMNGLSCLRDAQADRHQVEFDMA